MAIISKDVYQRTHDIGVEVFFVPRAATKWWNARRRDPKTEIALLGGYYWAQGREEHGPFRSASAAWRDAYYRRVARTRPPTISSADVERAAREAVDEQRRERRRRRRAGNVVELRRVA